MSVILEAGLNIKNSTGNQHMAENTDQKNQVRSSRRKSDAELSNYLFGKVPPQARDLEDAVLGAMMLQKSSVSDVIDILRAEHFYHEGNQKIYAAILELFDRSEPIDILTVSAHLRKNGQLDTVGGPYYVTELTNRVASAANIEYHARIVAQKYVQRELIRISTEIINEAYEDTTDVFDLLQKAEQSIYNITDQNLRRDYQKTASLIKQALEEIEITKNRTEDLTGVPTGIFALDRITAGWQRSDLIIVAARPGMGKTSFVLSVARNAAVDFKKKIAVFSLEMSAVQLTKRLISSETMIPLNKLRTGNLEEHEWIQLVHQTDNLGEAEIFIDDTPAINIFELRAKCRRLKQKGGIDMILIDYLQLMSGVSGDKKNFNREQEISNISRSLKTIAKELDVPVIALSQLSRAVETRGGVKRPQLSDLRESGAIEQDADLVIFLYRPEYYGIHELEDNSSSKGVAEVIIAKHRNGPTDTVLTRFIDSYAKFTNLNDDGGMAGMIPLNQAIAGDTPPSTGGNTITVGSRINDEYDKPENPSSNDGEVFGEDQDSDDEDPFLD